jgi:hypothetical protein
MGVHRTPNVRRRGAVVLEFILTLSVIVILFFAAFQFGMKTMYQAAVVHAATVGAREAGKVSGVANPYDPADALVDVVVPTVQQILAVHCIDVNDPGTRIILEDGGHPTQYFGDAAVCNEPSDPDLTPLEVRVTVCVDISATPFGNAFMGGLCNGLEDFGLSFVGQKLYATSVVRKELAQDLLPP